MVLSQHSRVESGRACLCGVAQTGWTSWTCWITWIQSCTEHNCGDVIDIVAPCTCAVRPRAGPEPHGRHGFIKLDGLESLEALDGLDGLDGAGELMRAECCLSHCLHSFAWVHGLPGEKHERVPS